MDSCARDSRGDPEEPDSQPHALLDWAMHHELSLSSASVGEACIWPQRKQQAWLTWHACCGQEIQAERARLRGQDVQGDPVLAGLARDAAKAPVLIVAQDVRAPCNACHDFCGLASQRLLAGCLA